jgi:hypothetical protein
MPDIFYLIKKWWKQVFGLVLFSLVAVAIVVFLQPSRYLSVATALPASSSFTDKARVFNDNIEHLYSGIGNPDELDRIIGTAQLDTVYLSIATDFNLWDHYNTKEKNNEEKRIEAAAVLKKNVKVIKSEYGELKVKVWDTDKKLAPQLANALLEKLNDIHQVLQSESNRHTLVSLRKGQNKLLSSPDTLSVSDPDIKTQQVIEYEKLIGEYQLMVDANPSALMVVEKARPSLRPDKPRRLLMLSATAILSFLFALLVALILERRKTGRL